MKKKIQVSLKAYCNNLTARIDECVKTQGRSSANGKLRPVLDVELFMCLINLMQMSSNKELRSLTLGSAHEKFDV